MSTIDFVAAQRVAQAKLLELAVHEPYPWSIRIADVQVECIRVVCPTRVVFLGFFPPRVWDVKEHVAWLCLNGEEKSSKIVEVADGEFSIEWSIGDAPTEREFVAS